MDGSIHRRPCSDFMDMLRHLISCRIIIIIIRGSIDPSNDRMD